MLRFGASADVVAASPNGLQNADDFDRADAQQSTTDAEVDRAHG